MTNKGIATRTILLLLVGTLVVVFLVYLTYKSATSTTLTKAECHSIIIDACGTCLLSDWGKGVKVPQKARDCVKFSEYHRWSDNYCCGESCCGAGTCGNTKFDCIELGLG